MVNEQSLWILILNWNGWRDTIACLTSLRPAIGGSERIVVIDNGSTDDSVIQLTTHNRQRTTPFFELIETGKNLGYAGGNNVGIQKALTGGAQWILLLNNDTIVAPDFLSKMREAAQKDPRLGLLNPKIYLGEPPSRILWFAGGVVDYSRAEGRHVGYKKEDLGQFDGTATEYATGCCLLARRETIEDIGLLPDAYFLYYEDTEWSVRARKKGWRCAVVPSAHVWHKGAASSRESSPAYIRYHVRNGLLFVRRNGNIPQIIFSHSISLARASWQGFKILIRPKKRSWSVAILNGIYDGWLGRTGQIKKKMT